MNETPWKSCPMDNAVEDIKNSEHCAYFPPKDLLQKPYLERMQRKMLISQMDVGVTGLQLKLVRAITALCDISSETAAHSTEQSEAAAKYSSTWSHVTVARGKVIH